MPWEVRLIEHTHTQTVGAHVVTLSHSHTHTLTHILCNGSRLNIKHSAEKQSHTFCRNTLSLTHTFCLMESERDAHFGGADVGAHSLAHARTRTRTHALFVRISRVLSRDQNWFVDTNVDSIFVLFSFLKATEKCFFFYFFFWIFFVVKVHFKLTF